MAAVGKNFGFNKPPYNDVELLDRVQKELHALPALIKHYEVDVLRGHLEKVFHRQAFIIQVGDCAERFSEASQAVTYSKYQQLIFLKSFIERALDLPVIAIGRIAGQYAKPRSAMMETVSDKSVYAYYGDIINAEHSKDSRHADPNRILQAYNVSKAVLSYLATFEKFVFTSHECFLLEYEKPLTRIQDNICYNLSTHFPWLGMRNILSEPHINYLSNIANPVALKIGTHTSPFWMVSAIQRLNPINQVGKIALVIRLGIDKVDKILPIFIQAIHENKLNVIWMCDPLHGNTQSDQYRKKFRLLKHAIEETIKVCDILHQSGTHLAGLHLEASYREDIQECISSHEELIENRIYESALDPRLNHNQCITYLEHVLEKINSLAVLI